MSGKHRAAESSDRDELITDLVEILWYHQLNHIPNQGDYDWFCSCTEGPAIGYRSGYRTRQQAQRHQAIMVADHITRSE